jgi:hypothetical protein
MSGRLWSLAAALAVQACASLGGSGDEDDDLRTHYTLRAGEKTVHPAPLPVEASILVDWHHADGSKKTVTGFRGYDFGGDERFEMVEVLNEDGTVQSYVYDFDGDGRVDRIAPAPPAKAEPAAPAGKPPAGGPAAHGGVPAAEVAVAGPMPVAPIVEGKLGEDEDDEEAE